MHTHTHTYTLRLDLRETVAANDCECLFLTCLKYQAGGVNSIIHDDVSYVQSQGLSSGTERFSQ